MYDLHCHLLPNIDDGARDLPTALEMARIAAGDGITHLACTPHIYPGLFENTAESIAKAVQDLDQELKSHGIALELSYGADIQVVPEMVGNLHSCIFPTINESRYFLFEPSHHVPLQNFDGYVFDSISAGFVPMITHPERLRWLEDHYREFVSAAHAGAWIQLTAGSLVGRFGKAPRYWAEKMLDDGIVHLLATDGHNLKSRPPLLAEGAEAAAKYVGKEEASRLVLERPGSVWENAEPADISQPPGLGDFDKDPGRKAGGLLRRLFRSAR
ncbi:MAG TPA: capsular biosynthesis protein [Chromatiaceae bacterium]|nr:capsular biosynthesis protein [Chromatiaceae bacterium]